MAPLDIHTPTAWSALGWAVIHFLWQGALIGLLAALLLDALRQRSALARYLVASGALLASLLVFILTFFRLSSADALLFPMRATSTAGAAPFASLSTSFVLPLNAADAVAWCWALGVLFMALRFTWHWRWAQRLKTELSSEPSAAWHALFQSLKTELGVERGVRLLRSSLAQVPMVVGWFAPVILIPASAFTLLTPDQLRLILSHELAHIRRHDHLMNLGQCLIESILFFHPITWWISKQIRQEREHCCDDASIRCAGDPRHLAEALTQLESLRTTAPMTTLSAKGSSLMHRISKILGAPTGEDLTHLGSRAFVTGTLAMLFAAAGLTSLNLSCAQAPSAANSPSSEVQERGVAREQIAGIRRRMGGIEARVEAGLMTREEADAAMRGLRKRLAKMREDPKRRGFSLEDYRRAEEKIKKMVADGKVSEEDAERRLAGMRRAMDPNRHERGEINWDGLRRRIEAGNLTDEALEGIKKRIDAAFEAGKMTREEAGAAYRRIKGRVKGKEEPKDDEDEASDE